MPPAPFSRPGSPAEVGDEHGHAGLLELYVGCFQFPLRIGLLSDDCRNDEVAQSVGSGDERHERRELTKVELAGGHVDPADERLVRERLSDEVPGGLYEAEEVVGPTPSTTAPASLVRVAAGSRRAIHSSRRRTAVLAPTACIPRRRVLPDRGHGFVGIEIDDAAGDQQFLGGPLYNFEFRVHRACVAETYRRDQCLRCVREHRRHLQFQVCSFVRALSSCTQTGTFESTL